MAALSANRAHRLDIRGTRATKLARAGTDHERGALYGAALQQFEDLLSAAEASGYAGRPVPLFYALSQAGRAVVAAFGVQGTVDGHGLREDRSEPESTGLLARGIKRAEAKNGGDAFGAVAAACGSPTFTGSATLGAIWAATPGASDCLVCEWENDWCPPLLADLGVGDDHRVGMTLYSTRGTPQRSLLAEALAGPRYPNLPIDVDVDVSWGFGAPQKDAVVATASWDSEGQPAEDALRSRLTRSSTDLFDDGMLVPAVNSGSAVMAPLMSWWALLFALSIFARYHPRLWVASLDPDASEVAVPLQALLDIAPDAVASLVWATLMKREPGPLNIGRPSWSTMTEEQREEYEKAVAERGVDAWHRTTT